MGMFDRVQYKDDCLICKKPLDEFQSKDGPCVMTTVLPSEVRGFYAYCEECGAWNQYQVEVREYEVKRVVQRRS